MESKERQIQAPSAAKKAWIVVASGHTARIYEEDSARGLRLIDKIICTRGGKLRHQLSHMEEAGPDDAAFVREVGEWLKEHADKGMFESFAVVAEHKMLTHLKAGFGSGFEEKMARHIDYGLEEANDAAVTEKLCNIMYF
ncbi:MAG: hypothetical protein K0R10_1584 [Alphaproteobacteria bacterium]|jgi:hypothetical protein|nr:hypothetical protein [Alphaproteobacteria bacterium]